MEVKTSEWIDKKMNRMEWMWMCGNGKKNYFRFIVMIFLEAYYIEAAWVVLRTFLLDFCSFLYNPAYFDECIFIS